MQYAGTVDSGMQKDSLNGLVFCNLLACRNEAIFSTSGSFLISDDSINLFVDTVWTQGISLTTLPR